MNLENPKSKNIISALLAKIDGLSLKTRFRLDLFLLALATSSIITILNFGKQDWAWLLVPIPSISVLIIMRKKVTISEK